MMSITERPLNRSFEEPEGLSDALTIDPASARDPGRLSRPAALRHQQFRTLDLEDARRFFATAYKPGWQITSLDRGSAVKHRRCDAGSVSLDEVMIQGQAKCEIRGAKPVLVIQPRAGSLSTAASAFRDVECPVLVAEGIPCALQVNSAQFDVVTIGEDVLRKVAAGQHAPLPQRIRFLDWRPRSHAAVRAWHRAMDYVTATLASADAVHQPLIVASAATVAATALLECYASNLTADNDVLSDPGVPDALKDAVSFIHRHAASDVGVHEVAEAVHLTPRSVQYLFKHQLDTTPTRYMRRVRLHRAHLDLLASDRSTTTVSDIAQRWGFVHTGRFAVQYRQTYGQSPHTTLRQLS
jgi:AraC-like DNA-binding protein